MTENSSLVELSFEELYRCVSSVLYSLVGKNGLGTRSYDLFVSFASRQTGLLDA